MAEIFSPIQIKMRNLQIPVIAVGDIRTLNRGNVLIQRGDCDFAAYGRPFLAVRPEEITHLAIEKRL